MIHEDYVSFEIAKLLKEKGFDTICDKVYREHDSYLCPFEYCMNFKGEGYYLAPTHQMAMKWLREVHKLLISIDASPIYGKVKDDKGKNTCGLLYWHYMASGIWLNEEYSPYQRVFVVSGKSYEQAVENALLYALEKLT